MPFSMSKASLPVFAIVLDAAAALLEPDAAMRDEPLPAALLEPLFDD